MIGIVGFIAIFVVTYFVYKTARGTERNPALWAAVAFIVGFGFQIVLPMLVGIALGVYWAVSGRPMELFADEMSGILTVASIVGLVLSFVSMWLVIRHVSRIPDDGTFGPADQPPAPPTFV